MPTPTAIARFLPFLSWWPRVSRATLRADTSAALVSAIVVLPQAVAFATLAGMPPEYGLYCAMVPAVVAAFFGSSWHAVSGPTNAVSLYVFATLAPLAAPGSSQYVGYALTLAFMAGVIMLALGLLRLGRVVNFVSHSVVVGFTAGAAVLIVASQLKNFFGLDLPASSAFLTTLRGFLAQLPELKPWVVVVGVVTLAAGVLSRRYVRKVPFMIMALAVGGLTGFALNLWLGPEQTGIRTIGRLAGALPPLSAPDLSPDTLTALLGIAVGVTLLSLTEAMSIARAVALKSGQRIDANQEFIGQGLSNMAASFFSGYPSSASFNTLVRDGMPLLAAMVFCDSADIAHLMNSADVAPFFDAFGMASIQLPIMPMPLPDGPAGMGVYSAFPMTCDVSELLTMPAISPGHTDDCSPLPVAKSCDRSAASVLASTTNLHRERSISGPAKPPRPLRSWSEATSSASRTRRSSST